MKIVVIITLKQGVISISNFAQGLTMQVALRDMTLEVKRLKIKVTRSHNVFN